MPRLVLASASPRRHDLLRRAGVDFEIDPADVDETVGRFERAELAAEELALRKARAVAERRPDAEVVLGSDTIVAVGSDADYELLEKPTGPEDAARMLRRLSGERHRVVTGVAVVGPGEREAVAHERTWVTMRPLAPDEVAAYVRSGEWEGKAGGYAIQESADAFVTSLEEGGFDNVVGLPVGLTLALLRPFDVLPG